MSKSSDSLIPDDAFASDFWNDVVVKTDARQSVEKAHATTTVVGGVAAAAKAADVDKIVRSLADGPLTRTDVRDLFGRHRSKKITAACDLMVSTGVARVEKIATDGRSAERLVLASPAKKPAAHAVAHAKKPAAHAVAHAKKRNACAASHLGCDFTTNGNSIGRHQQWCPLHLVARLYDTGNLCVSLNGINLEVFLTAVKNMIGEAPRNMGQNIRRRFGSYEAMAALVNRTLGPAKPSSHQLSKAIKVIDDDGLSFDEFMPWDKAALEVLEWVASGKTTSGRIKELAEKSAERMRQNREAS